MMKIDNEIRDELMSNMRLREFEYRESFARFYRKAKQAETVEEIMEYKQELLMELVQNLPLTVDTCYFCLLHNFEDDVHACNKCEYKKFHGKCTEDESDFSSIMNKVHELAQEIDGKYYKGSIVEIYE